VPLAGRDPPHGRAGHERVEELDRDVEWRRIPKNAPVRDDAQESRLHDVSDGKRSNSPPGFHKPITARSMLRRFTTMRVDEEVDINEAHQGSTTRIQRHVLIHEVQKGNVARQIHTWHQPAVTVDG
jgi:hypothetical protein